MTLSRKIRIDGRGVGVRLPSQLAEAAELEPGTIVNFEMQGKTILMTPATAGQGEAGAGHQTNGGIRNDNAPPAK